MDERKNEAKELRWHYTIREFLKLILRDGLIKLATDAVPEGERPASWFSTNQDWEGTARNAGPDQRARIGVLPEDAPVGWDEYLAQSGIQASEAERLVETGRQHGARPEEWFVSFEPVPRAKWVRVEVWVRGNWVTFEGATDETPAE